MLLCFVDESDQGDFHGFAGLMADEHATKAITDSLNRIVRQIAVDWGIPATTELHGHPVFHGKEDWKHVPTRVRVGVFHKVFEAVVTEDVVILMRWVHAARLAERQARNFYPVNFPPEQVCFQHILQRAQQVSVRRDTYTLIIADDRHDRDRHRERFAIYQTEGTPGVYMQTNLDRLLDTVHFAPSHMSRMSKPPTCSRSSIAESTRSPSRIPVPPGRWRSCGRCWPTRGEYTTKATGRRGTTAPAGRGLKAMRAAAWLRPTHRM